MSAPSTRTGPREARETNGITSRLILAYAERVGGAATVDAVLARAGLTERADELRDENTWFSFATKIRLFEALAEVLGDPAATRRAGALALELNVAPGLKVALRALGSPPLVYRNIVRANAKFTTRHVMELVELGSCHARIRFADVTGGEVHPLDCQYNIGLLSCVPALFGQGAARVSHPACAVDGADGCVYDITWERPGITPRSVVATAALGAAAVAGAALAAPALLPVAGAGAAGGAAWLAARRARERRGRWRALENEVAEQATVSERLSASLQDLVSTLHVDELLDKVVANAHAAVAGKEFALLVAEDGGLVCRASTGLSGGAVAALETWAQAMPSLRREEPVLVEDTITEPALAALTEVPLRSLCAAPLVVRGEAVGVLVALTGQARAFLPRDVDLVRDYAVQAAIALANARLFAAQHALATRDALTGVFNHREFHEILGREMERGRRYGARLSVVLLDLNSFKLVNDASGHAAGDRVLRETAAALERACRESDLAFRLGGDEFALLLPETDGEAAQAVARRAADAVREIDARTSAAFGVASWPADGEAKDDLLAQADARLYAMKGRERVAGERLAVSVTVGGRAWGLLSVESPEVEAFSHEDVALVETAAADLGAALQRRHTA